MADARIQVQVDPDGAGGSFNYDLDDAVRTTITKVDLDIATGGSDLDNGKDNNSPPSAVLPEAAECDPTGDGAYLLVNWDDDGDGISFVVTLTHHTVGKHVEMSSCLKSRI